MKKLLPPICFVMIFGLCSRAWSMDQLNKDIAASEAEIDRIKRERIAVQMNHSIPMYIMVELKEYYADVLHEERINHQSLQRKKVDLQKKLVGEAKL